ncbi:hypothetical protein EV183_003882 [Coemansia sp. RSA 2336]|nr:hypothetical protein EV183_003882 [Coemansia sp. RSA 2336]
MDDGSVSVDIGFLGGCYLHGDSDHGASTLVSFDLVRFILFAVMLTIAGPFVYRLVAAFFDLERDFKSVADHFDDVTNGLLYTFVVFTLGNYAHTFGWVTVVFYAVGIFGYSALVELPFMRVSIPGWRTWSWSAWAVNLSGVALVLLAAGFHIYWAYDAGILQWYLPLFVLATASLWVTVLVQRLNNYCVEHCPQGLGIERQMRKLALTLFVWRSTKKENGDVASHAAAESSRAKPAAGSDHPEYGIPLQNMGSSEGEASDMNGSSLDLAARPLHHSPSPQRTTMSHEEKQAHIEQKLQNLHYLNVRPGRPLPLPKCRLHLHHWQIFYILAFFTRFDRFASSACAGIVLGIVTQGSAAYGYDSMLERS